MKIGDLVELSAYGEARDQNEGYQYGFGIIVEQGTLSWDKYPIKCLWFNYDDSGCNKGYVPFHRRELKKYKPDKK